MRDFIGLGSDSGDVEKLGGSGDKSINLDTSDEIVVLILY
jgi:hypothetical protein